MSGKPPKLRCAAHTECPPDMYCDGNKTCFHCGECPKYHDGVDGNCEARCDSVLAAAAAHALMGHH